VIVRLESAEKSPRCPCGCGDVLSVVCLGDDGTPYDWRMSEPDLARFEALYGGVTRVAPQAESEVAHA
jgi:hypothetical protein